MPKKNNWKGKKSTAPLQANLAGTYSFNYQTLTLFPIEFDQKPSSRSRNRECYNIRMGNVNQYLLWVNHKDYHAECCQIHWYTLAEDASQEVVVFVYGGDTYSFPMIQPIPTTVQVKVTRV